MSEREAKLSRIARRLVTVSEQLPDPIKASFFLRNVMRLHRAIHKQPIFRSTKNRTPYEPAID